MWAFERFRSPAQVCFGKMDMIPTDIIHIGDNIISDMWSPLKLGMKGVF